ncbi:MAG: alpha/beta-type small acid-soluble spore protein [Eubacteriales bacterium]
MAKGKAAVPEAKQYLNNMKYEIATELGVNLKQGYNGDLTAKQNGSVGGEMVKRMIQQAENSMPNQ